MSQAIPVKRGCGSRVAGGVYLEAGLSKFGKPVEHFVVDPVEPLPAGFRVAPIGVSLIEQGGINYVVDWIGGKDYPNVADFLEEVRRFGLSRRAPVNFAFDKLMPNSGILLVHGRGHVGNWREYGTERDHPCPKFGTPKMPPTHSAPTHERREPMCAGLWWDDVDHGTPHEDPPPGLERSTLRTMPSFQYRARSRPETVKPSYAPAIIAAFPITHITVVKDPKGGTHEKALRAAEKAQMFIEISLEDE